MKLRSIKELHAISGKKIFLRLDLNIPLKSNGTVDIQQDDRIRLILPTIQYLRSKGAIIIIASHLGRPEGKRVKKFSMAQVARHAEKIFGAKIIFLGGCVESTIKNRILRAEKKDIFFLENLRFYPQEENNSTTFARELSKLADIYINDAFSNCHRNHASMVAITRYLPSYAGLRLAYEIKNIESFIRKPRRPLLCIMGGAKISTKFGLIKKLFGISDALVLGGALANTMLQAFGKNVGKSLKENIPKKKAWKLFSSNEKKIFLPSDAVCAKVKTSQKSKIKKISEISPHEAIYDIGPDTVKNILLLVKKSNSILWNGPMGFIENPMFSHGTQSVLAGIIQLRKRCLFGGGDMLRAIRYAGKKIPKNIFISSGGGAMLEFIERGDLPALLPLKKVQ